MENSFSKPYLALFAEARKNLNLGVMESLFTELCQEVGLKDPQEQADEQAKMQAAIDMGKAIAEKQNNALKQGAERNGMQGIKI